MINNKREWLPLGLILASAAMLVPADAAAVTAAPGFHQLRQPDGTTFQARQWGDEQIHGWETREGYAVVQDPERGAWTYAVRDEAGRLMSSGTPVGAPRPEEIPARLRPSPTALRGVRLKMTDRERSAAGAAAPGAPSARERAIPAGGTGQLVTLLVNFSNTTTTNTAAEFTSLIYSTGTNSVNDYYKEVSHDDYDLAGVVSGWHVAASGHDYYGTNDVNGDDAYPGTLVRQAVAAFEAANPAFNWAPYDRNGDCYVDALAVIHQGAGEEASGVASDIWSHRWSLSSAYYYGRSDAGAYSTHTTCSSGGAIKVNDYIIQPERYDSGITTIGVIAHEYGHALGLPDLYDYDSSSEGVGNWSLMAGGSWNRVTRYGDRPAHLDPWCKYSLGWAAPVNVPVGVAAGGADMNVTIDAAAIAPTVIKMGAGTATTGEYYLIEDRYKTGFDAGLPGSGLLIWHVDPTRGNNNVECTPGGAYGEAPCTATTHYKVTLVQADNLWEMERGIDRGDAGDVYSSTGKALFDSSSSPASAWYDADNDILVSVEATSPANTAMSVHLSLDTAPVAAAESYNMEKATVLNVAAASGVLANDADTDGDAVVAVTSATTTHGTLSLNADGSFSYAPNPGFAGTDSFSYRASDTVTNSAPVTVNIDVTNATPVAGADRYDATAGKRLVIGAATGLLVNDSDADNDTLVVSANTSPSHGTLSLSADGSFSYTANASYSGTDSFTYRVSDGYTPSVSTTVTLQVKAGSGGGDDGGGGGGGGGADLGLPVALFLAWRLRRKQP